MQKILIIYNSGAGSTKTIVEIYHTLLNAYQVDILSASFLSDFSIFNDYELLIFAFPCYHSDVSPLMSELIERVPKQVQIKKAFTFITYGLYAGNTLRTFIKKCAEKNIYIEGYADYRAPATDGSLLFPPLKFMYEYEKKIAENILNDIEKIQQIISSSSSELNLPYFKPYTLLNYPNAWIGKKIKPQIKVREDFCTHCNLCVNKCPRGCWTVKYSHLVFNKSKCDSCYKCIHQCPQEALILSKKTIQKRKMNSRFYQKWKDKIMSEIKSQI